MMMEKKGRGEKRREEKTRVWGKRNDDRKERKRSEEERRGEKRREEKTRVWEKRDQKSTGHSKRK